MAIIMIATMIVGLYSCSKDDDNTPTTYTLKWNTETYGVDDVMCFEYTIGGSPRWIQQIFFLKAGTNTDVEVTDKTIVGRKEP